MIFLILSLSLALFSASNKMMMRQLLHGEYLQSQLQACTWKQLLKGEAAVGDRVAVHVPVSLSVAVPCCCPGRRGCAGWESSACQIWPGSCWAALLLFLQQLQAASASPQCWVRAALLRSFELASDAIMTISFIHLFHSCLNLFLSWGPGWQAFWGRDDGPITLCPPCLIRCLAKYAGTPSCCCGLNAQQLLQYFNCWSVCAWFSSVLLSYPGKHSEI